VKSVLSVILSLVILVLSAVPCNDQDDIMATQNQTVILTVEQAPASAFDICNPFFFCHTGHNAFIQSESFFTEFLSSPVCLFSENPIFTDIILYYPIWHPPKG
jgi:hypothetical protein